MLHSLPRNLRLACRMLAVRPAWTAAAVLCLAIASAANTAAFTLVNGLLLRPLPFDNPSELLVVALRDPSTSGPRPGRTRAGGEADQPAGIVQALLGAVTHSVGTFQPFAATRAGSSARRHAACRFLARSRRTVMP